MKNAVRIITCLALLVLCQPARAEQWLTAVDLGTKQQIKGWHQAGLPANELIGSTAIAVLDETQLHVAQQSGFIVTRLEQYDPQANYLVADQKHLSKDIDGRLLWRSGISALYHAAMQSERVGDHAFRALNKTALPERFWEHAGSKIVTLSSLPYDPYIQGLVDQVNGDSVFTTVERLQAFHTRENFTDSLWAASQWVYDKYQAMGLLPMYDSVFVDYSYNAWERSGLGVLPGIGINKRIITGGHLDDASSIVGDAPGADDDASGVAGAMEIARVLRTESFSSDMVFAAWAGEEYGSSVGAGHYAYHADSLGVNIAGVVNLDMLGCQLRTNPGGWLWYTHDHSIWLAELFQQTGQLYGGFRSDTVQYTNTPCDHIVFSQLGYPSITIIEPNPYGNPYIHSPNDVVAHLDTNYFVGLTKTALATMVSLDRIPALITNVSASDIGDGERLQVTWDQAEEPGITGYKIYWGTNSTMYNDSLFVPGASVVCDTIEALQADTTYYIIVRAVSANGYQSFAALEVTGIPRSVPLTPTGLDVQPVSTGITLRWHRNNELDIAGYKLYRGIISGSFDSLSFTTDLTYTDQPLSGMDKYYYKIQAIDNDGNGSPVSDSVLGRPFTLDQGVLIVDETYNWTNGNFPRDTTQDKYYNYLLWDYKHTQYEFGNTSLRPVLSDFAPYSTVLWHGDDYSYPWAKNDTMELRCYLDGGGRVLFVGWKPGRNLAGVSVDNMARFTNGSILHDYFKLDSAVVTPSDTLDEFAGAIGIPGSPDISVDSAKVPLGGWRGCMRYIEALGPTTEGQAIYTMDMRNNASPYEGKICGIEYLGPTYKTALLGFPLYFMKQDQARAVVAKIMTDFGEEYVGVTERPELRIINDELRLGQSRPNPFRTTTTMEYQIPKSRMVNLGIYNIAGQLVRTLVNGQNAAGSHAITWDGRDQAGRALSGGVYFMRLSADGRSQTRKVVYLR